MMPTGRMNPLRSRMQQMMPQPNSNMPVMEPPPMDQGMVQNGPYGMGDPGMDMPPGQGDMGMEAMYDKPPARAMPVHSMGEAQQFYKGMGMPMGAPAKQMTSAYEGAPAGPIREKLHSTQHQMMVGDQSEALRMQGMKLSMQNQQIRDAMTKIRRGNIMDAGGRKMQMLRKMAQDNEAALSALLGGQQGGPGGYDDMDGGE